MSKFKEFTQVLKATVNDVADKAVDVAKDATDMAKDLAKDASDKAKTLSRITKVNMEINTERDNLETIYTEIGKLYFESQTEAPDDFFAALFEQAKFAIEHIEEMEAEVAALKAEDEVEEEACCCGDDDCCCADIEVEVVEEACCGEEGCCCADIEVEVVEEACCGEEGCCCGEEAVEETCCCGEDCSCAEEVE